MAHLDASVRRILRVNIGEVFLIRRSIFKPIIEDRNYNALHRRVSREVATGLFGSKSGEMLPLNPALSEGGCHGPARTALQVEKEANIEVIKIPWRTSRTLRQRYQPYH